MDNIWIIDINCPVFFFYLAMRPLSRGLEPKNQSTCSDMPRNSVVKSTPVKHHMQQTLHAHTALEVGVLNLFVSIFHETPDDNPHWPNTPRWQSNLYPSTRLALSFGIGWNHPPVYHLSLCWWPSPLWWFLFLWVLSFFWNTRGSTLKQDPGTAFAARMPQRIGVDLDGLMMVLRHLYVDTWLTPT